MDKYVLPDNMDCVQTGDGVAEVFRTHVLSGGDMPLSSREVSLAWFKKQEGRMKALENHMRKRGHAMNCDWVDIGDGSSYRMCNCGFHMLLSGGK